LEKIHIELPRNNASLKRFEIFIEVLAIAALAFCLPAAAQEQNAWQFGSLPVASHSSANEM
jgi:hypothetical protein